MLFNKKQKRAQALVEYTILLTLTTSIITACAYFITAEYRERGYQSYMLNLGQSAELYEANEADQKE
jgi:hypothetical protein